MKIKIISILLAILMVSSLFVSCGEKEQTFEEAARTLQDEIAGFGYLTYEITEIDLRKVLIIRYNADKYGDEAVGMSFWFIKTISEEYSTRIAELFGHIDGCAVVAVAMVNGKSFKEETLFVN